MIIIVLQIIKKIKSKTWNVIYIEDSDLSNVLLARKVKILGNELINKKYDILVWIDAAVEFVKPINDFVKNFMGKNDSFVCFKHGMRNSIEEEMNACLRFRKENIENINSLKKFYKKEDYKYDNGLIESTVYIKRPTDKIVIETMNLWYKMVFNYSKRDQLSFNYCIYKTNLKVKWIEEYVFNNDWFLWHDHFNESYPTNYMMYFGNIDNYNYELQLEGEYKIENNNYLIEEKVKNDTNEIYVELSNVPIIKYDIKINQNVEINYENTIIYRENKIFFKSPGFVLLKGEFKKGDNIKIVVHFTNVEEYEKNKIIDYFICKFVNKFVTANNEIEKLRFELKDTKAAYKELKESYDKILDSISWKLTKPLRKISSKIKK